MTGFYNESAAGAFGIMGRQDLAKRRGWNCT